MGQRLDLHTILKGICDNVYFQPPPTIRMSYPCIVYNRDDVRIDHADNVSYGRTVRYQVTVIDKNPDSDIPAQLERLPMCAFDRFYTADQLNHDVYNIFF